jgi:ubiquinone/menaquinone biosynthesis C-methylase UbiE
MNEPCNRQFYDRNVTYQEMLQSRRGDPLWFRHFYDAVLNYSNPESRILDVGCGTGVTTCHLHQFRPNIQGVDFSNLFIEKARQYASFFDVMDMTNLKFPDQTFDLVCSTDAIEHVAGLERGLREMMRIVKPGGYLVVQAPNLSCGVLSTNYERTLRGVCRRCGRMFSDFWNPALKTIEQYRLDTLTGDKDAYNLISPIWLRRFFSKNNFQVCSQTTYACYFKPSPLVQFIFSTAEKLPLMKEIGGRLVIVVRRGA